MSLFDTSQFSLTGKNTGQGMSGGFDTSQFSLLGGKDSTAPKTGSMFADAGQFSLVDNLKNAMSLEDGILGGKDSKSKSSGIDSGGGEAEGGKGGGESAGMWGAMAMAMSAIGAAIADPNKTVAGELNRLMEQQVKAMQFQGLLSSLMGGSEAGELAGEGGDKKEASEALGLGDAFDKKAMDFGNATKPNDSSSFLGSKQPGTSGFDKFSASAGASKPGYSSVFSELFNLSNTNKKAGGFS